MKTLLSLHLLIKAGIPFDVFKETSDSTNKEDRPLYLGLEISIFFSIELLTVSCPLKIRMSCSENFLYFSWTHSLLQEKKQISPNGNYFKTFRDQRPISLLPDIQQEYQRRKSVKTKRILPVVQYSTVQHCTALYSARH